MQEKKIENTQNTNTNGNDNKDQQNSNSENISEGVDNQEDKDDEVNIAISGSGKTPIHNIELVFIYPIVIVAEIADLISWTGIGTIISWVLDAGSMGVVMLWLLLKGRRVDYNLIAGALEFIPGVDVLPMRFIALTVLVITDRNEIAGRALQKIKETSAKKAATKK